MRFRVWGCDPASVLCSLGFWMVGGPYKEYVFMAKGLYRN